MTLGKAIGFGMIAALFLLMFVGGLASVGLLATLGIFGAVALLFVWIFVGVSLIHPV